MDKTIQKVGSCRKEHYGISRFTLRKWYKRYEELGEKGLVDLSSKPKTSPLQKINESRCAVETQGMFRKEQTKYKSYAIDEGRSLGAGLQEQVSNSHKLLW
ncbi:MAG: helix-turn-helix domain-containing protein [Wolbachia endosymbiont of Homalodisca vitripennis]|nr:helix-turn-helix domain-containing protein [Wolbachia endosymbiont of Homalodisca vitripennis]MCJ7475915.1 helix-turn-helix domain-containing protein [Wolbachia endosymbiont of Homalodisca vitripennis]